MLPDYIDIHTHLNFAAYDADREEVISRMKKEGVWCINVGTQIDTSQKAIELAEKHEGLFAAIGLHPIHTSKSHHDKNELGEGGHEFTSRGESFDVSEYRALAQHPKTVAIGECGLDYYRVEDSKFEVGNSLEKQEEMFRNQIELAIEVDKPLMLHLRNGSGRSAYKDAFSILNSYLKTGNSHPRGNLHFFAGTKEEAKLFLDIGYTFSFTGVVTFADSYSEVIRYIPLESIMTETDAPYVAPSPFRGKRNEPSFVRYTVEKLAFLKGIDLQIFKKQVVLNACRVFKIPTQG